VPRFDAGDDMLSILRSSKRVLEQRHGFAKVAVQRHFRAAKNERIGKGSHTIERFAVPGEGTVPCRELHCPPDAVSIAHMPIRSRPQFIAKFASGWLGALASGTVEGDESFHWREAYAHLRAGKPVDAAQLTAFAANYGVRQDRWRAVEDIALIDEPFLAPVELRYSDPRGRDPFPLVLAVAERLLAERVAPRTPLYLAALEDVVPTAHSATTLQAGKPSSSRR